MRFTSLIFLLVFLPLSVLAYFAVVKKYRNTVLLLFCLFFYAWGEPVYIFLLGILILANHVFGSCISKAGGTARKALLVVSLCFNGTALLFFKYAEFLSYALSDFISAFWVGLGGFVPIIEFALPLGISIYVLQAVSYNVDIYRGENPPESIVDTGLYLSLFPLMVVGPIVKYKDFRPQLSERSPDLRGVSDGLLRFSAGLVKTVLIGGNLAYVTDEIFMLSKSQLSFTVAWTGIICLALQMYYCFSGYADMAVGLMRVFGFSVPEEIDDPYFVTSVSAFWKRWRKSVGAWFCEYIYIPIGGNRKRGSNEHSLKWMYINMAVTIFLCALWFGASWMTIYAGVFFGIFLMIEKTYKFGEIYEKVPKFFRWLYSILIIMIAWVIFRSGSLNQAGYILKAVVGLGGGSSTLGAFEYFNREAFVAFAAAVLFIIPQVRRLPAKLCEKYPNAAPALKIAGTAVIAVLAIYAVISAASGNVPEFAYFRF